MEERLLGLYQLSSQLVLANSCQELYHIFSSALKKVLKFDTFALLIKQDEELKIVEKVGIYEPPFPLKLNGEKGITVACAKERKTIYVPDVSKDERYVEASPRIKSEIAVPILYRNELIGVIDVEKAELNGFNEEDKRLLEIFANMLSAAFKNVEFKKRLEDSERKYRSIFENAVEGIYRLDKNGKIIEANKALEEFFGYTEEELKKMDLKQLYKNPEERKHFFDRLKKDGFLKNYEVEYIRKDGKTVIGNEYAVLVREAMEEYIDGIIHDITELKKAQQEAEFYHTLLRHDVANKLQLIIGYLAMLLEEEMDKEHAELAELAMKAALTASKIIDNVRKLQILKKDVEKKKIDVDAMMHRIIEEYSKDAKEKGIEMKYEDFGKYIMANEFLREVLSNIVWNAIIHSKADKIKISVKEEKNGVKIFIEDNGVGISDEMKREIFKMGTKGKESKGSGLGLYLVKKLVEGMGGKIEVKDGAHDGEKKGTVFEIYLPQ